MEVVAIVRGVGGGIFCWFWGGGRFRFMVCIVLGGGGNVFVFDYRLWFWRGCVFMLYFGLLRKI